MDLLYDHLTAGVFTLVEMVKLTEQSAVFSHSEEGSLVHADNKDMWKKTLHLFCIFFVQNQSLFSVFVI